MKLRVVTHSGEDIILDVDSFNAEEFEEKANNSEISMIALGGTLFSRIDLKLVIPINEESSENISPE